MHRAGPLVAQHILPVTAEQVQSNGADLVFGAVLEQVEPGCLSHEGEIAGECHALGCTDPDIETYRPDPGGYILQCVETAHIPEGHVGFIYSWSSFMRSFCMLNTVVRGAGYEGRDEGLLEAHHPIELERGVRVAQIVLTSATYDKTYDDSYQGERVH